MSNSLKVSHWFWDKDQSLTMASKDLLLCGSCLLFSLILTSPSSPSLLRLQPHWSFSSLSRHALSYFKAFAHATSLAWKNVFLLFPWLNMTHLFELSLNIPFPGKQSLSPSLGLVSHVYALITSSRTVSSFRKGTRMVLFMMH